MSILYKPDYLKAYEVVDKWTYDKYGDFSLTFFDPRILMLADWLRKSLGGPVLCNNWKRGGNLDSRGLRQSNNDDHTIMSPHSRGQALDLDFSGYSAEEVRAYIKSHWVQIQEELGIYSLTIENNVNWLHVAVGNGEVGLNWFYPSK